MVGGVPDRAFLLLHGFSHHRPPGHWQYWLANRLRARGVRVLYPGLPFEDEPRYHEWREAVHWSLAELGTDGERIVICNSIACAVWMRFATERRPDEQPVDRLLLVVPPDSARVPDACADLRIVGVDGAAVRSTCRTTIRVVTTDNDPFNPDSGAKTYAQALGAELDLIPGGGHLGPVDGYGPWPSIQAWCFDPGVRVEANFPQLSSI